MIIITGPGRSGTSVVAQLYRELGFDPGGQWYPSVRAGLEAPDIVEVNNAIASELGIDPLIRGHRPGIFHFPPWVGSVAHSVKPFLPQWIVTKAKMLLAKNHDRSGQLRLADWEKFGGVVSKYQATLREISQSHEVVKDPRFSWTLMVWAAAGAQIDHVVVCIRALDSMVRSRLAAGHLETQLLGEAKNSLIYGMGMCLSALYGYDIPHSIIKFPMFLDDAAYLYKALQFPKHVEYKHFMKAFDHIIDRSKVHESTNNTNPFHYL